MTLASPIAGVGVFAIPGTHPAFYAAIDFEAFQTTAHNGFVRMTAPPREGLFYRGEWMWMWPNWSLSLFDGGMNVSRIDAASVHHTDQHDHFFFADTSPKLLKQGRNPSKAPCPSCARISRSAPKPTAITWAAAIPPAPCPAATKRASAISRKGWRPH
jgi:hypothetical protein